ncbi:MAG: glycosyltransferase [Hydrogenobaculum sp.]
MNRQVVNDVLTFNSHTAYSYLLSKIGINFDVCPAWDYESRVLPNNFNLITLKEAVENIRKGKYKTIITHEKKDLLLILKNINYIKDNKVNVIYTIHGRYHRGGIANKRHYRIAKFIFKEFLKSIVKLYDISIVFITPCVKVSWNMDGFVITPGQDIAEFEDSDFSINKLLVVGNNLHRHYFRFSLLNKIVKKFPIDIVGFNPKIPISKKAKNFEELIYSYKTHKAYLYLANEPEEGFNLSLLEAMASGLPVITMYHPTSPIIHGYNGLVAFNEKEYMEYCEELLNNDSLAKVLGKNAKETIKTQFSIQEFARKWKYVIER